MHATLVIVRARRAHDSTVDLVLAVAQLLIPGLVDRSGFSAEWAASGTYELARISAQAMSRAIGALHSEALS